MFTTLIVQPIFNLLVFVYAMLPGHNVGLAIIIFTVIVRLLMWPLVKKQLHQVRVMRRIQPELKRIKQEAKGNKRQEQLMMMELYKERGINPFGSLGVLVLQIPILFGLYNGLSRVIKDPHQIENFAYPLLRHLPWMKQLGTNIHQFDATLFHTVDLTRSALGPKGVYWPALIIVLASAAVQFFQSKQLAPSSKDARSLRTILKDAGAGKQADSSEVNAAVGRNMYFFVPLMILMFTINIPSALALYWLTSGLVALVQQSILLREDTAEMETEAVASVTRAKQREATAIEAEIVTTQPPKKSKKKQSGRGKKRRR